jgi:hypothetical protein
MVAERRCAGTLYTLYQSTLAVSPSVSRVVRVKEYVYRLGYGVTFCILREFTIWAAFVVGGDLVVSRCVPSGVGWQR